MFTIAVITIGQSPRPDITSDLRKLLPEGVCMTEYGALDGLTRQQAEEQFGYRGRGELLITRMGGSGSSLKVDGDSIMGQLQTCICRAQEDGADAALIACTGVFPDYEHQIPLLLPGEAQRKATMNLAGEQLMGVVIPKEHQREQIAGWWRESGARHILFGIADPYEDPKKNRGGGAGTESRRRPGPLSGLLWLYHPAAGRRPKGHRIGDRSSQNRSDRKTDGPPEHYSKRLS